MEDYEKQMVEASEDEEFIKRIKECQADFEFTDEEAIGEW